MDRWQDRVAVVTGASSGIGAAIARQLVNAGVIVVGLARRVDRMEAIKEELPAELQSKFHCIHCDVGDFDSLTAAFDWIEEHLGGCDILVNNAGCLFPGQLMTLEMEHLQQVLNVNLMGYLNCTRRAFRSMKQREVAGHVVLINSLTGQNIIYPPGEELQILNMYPLTKHAISAMLEVLRQEFRGFKTQIKITVGSRFIYFLFFLIKLNYYPLAEHQSRCHRYGDPAHWLRYAADAEAGRHRRWDHVRPGHAALRPGP